MNHNNSKKMLNKLFDMNHFDEWFEVNYTPAVFGNIPIPKKISFREHIRIMKEQENQYAKLLNEYNDLVDSYNGLQKAYCEATGERWAPGEIWCEEEE